MDVDVAVLGAGPGGYPAAIRARQLGLSVAVVEQGPMGGTCLNVGCIPTKAWVQSAHAAREARHHFKQLGINVSDVEVDWRQVQANKDAIVKGLVGGVGGLLKANGCTVVAGRGRFATANSIAVEGGETVNFKHAVIATGSSPTRPPVEGIDHARCLDSTGLLAVDSPPQRLIVLGGGVIGCEFASIFRNLGSEVTVVEFLDHLVAVEDADAVQGLERAFKRAGIAVHLGAGATRVEESGADMILHYAQGGETKSVSGDLILVATGRRANVADLGLDEVGIAYDAKGIRTDPERRTSLSHVFAVGDVAGYWQLAHTAFREGEIAAENAAGAHHEVRGAVPRCIYTDPEIGAVGLTEAQAREKFGTDRIAVGTFPYAAIARAAMHGDRMGFIKTIHETTYGELVGVVCVGTNATELVNAGVVALESEATIETLAESIAAHPTLAEGLKEAALVALGRPIHLPPARRR